MIEINKCVTKDLALLREVSQQTFVNTYAHLNDPVHFKEYLKHAFTLEQVKKELSNPNSEFYFLIENKKIIGYFKVNTGSAQSEGDDPVALEVERIYLVREAQGKGLGKRMLAFAEQLAKKRNKKYIWLGVWDQNPDAIAFYQRMGYSKFGEHIFTIGKDHQSDWMMKKEL